MQSSHSLISSGIIDEKEFLQTVDAISNMLAPTFRFGYHSYQDIKQESYILAVEALNNWDRVRSLSAFLYAHIKNRLCNLKRKQYERREPPCTNCPINAYCSKTKSCTKYDSLQDCQWYMRWTLRNNAKKSLMSPANIETSTTKGWREKIPLDNTDMLDWIETQLDGELKVIFIEARITGDIDEIYSQQILEIICPEQSPEKKSEET